MYDQIYAHERENLKFAEIRDYLLPKLLSGKVEVPAAEAVVGEAMPEAQETVHEQTALFRNLIGWTR